jgi:hypothetical protein
LVGLHGVFGAGRSTVAARLVGVHDFRSYSLGDPVRAALHALDPLLSTQESLAPLVDKVGWVAAAEHRIHGPEVSRLLRMFSFDVARDLFGPDVWVRHLESRVTSDADLLGPAPVVVVDVITADEAQWVHDNGGAVWLVERPGFVSSTVAPLPDRFISTVIKNDATLLALTRRVDRAAAGLPHNDDAPGGVKESASCQ